MVSFPERPNGENDFYNNLQPLAKIIRELEIKSSDRRLGPDAMRARNLKERGRSAAETKKVFHFAKPKGAAFVV
jgi:hypothetical protein